MQYKSAVCLAVPILACSFVLAACDSSDNDPVTVTVAQPTLTYHSVKTFRFSWSDVSDANHYKLLENPDGLSGFSQVGNDVLQGTERIDHIVPLYARTNAQYILQSCTENSCIDSDGISVSSTMVGSIGHVKASNTDSGDNFGGAVSLSANGTTLVVGAPLEDSDATGINSDQSNNAVSGAGAVYVFTKNGDGWSQQAYLKASNTGPDEIEPWDEGYGDSFGSSVSLSADGNTLVVGAPLEDSNATGVNGDQSDNSASRAGAVYVFTRHENEWHHQEYLKASNTGVDPEAGADEWGDFFGGSVSLSADGHKLAVGAAGEDSNATGVNGDQTDNFAHRSGAVYVFTRSNSEWSQQAYLKASNTGGGDYFGSSVSMSAYGYTLAVSAGHEDNSRSDTDGGQGSEYTTDTGAVYIFTFINHEWSQQALIRANNRDERDWFGGHLENRFINSVSLSADGNTLAVGAVGEDSNATQVNGVATDNSAEQSGAVYVFTREGDDWRQVAYLKSSNSDVVCDRFGNCNGDWFGSSVSLSSDGETLAIAAMFEDGHATGVDGDQNDNSLQSAGAVYVFTRSNGEWVQQAYVKASNTDAYYIFGSSVSLNVDGTTLAVGAPNESSNATGVNGDQNDNSSQNAGAVYLF